MKLLKIHVRLFLFIGLIFLTTNIFSQDPKFYIYLCFGQSNMEGQGTIEAQDKKVDSRFQVMEAVDCSNLVRKKGTWATAIPPLCRCWSGLSPADYFGRTMVANLPSNIKVGVINVSVAGCKIELYDKDNYQTYVSAITEDWLKNIIAAYNGNPYAYLVEIARLAQKDGVVKGILLHQGESNTNDNQWPLKVKGVYDNLIKDLGLNPDSIPLLAGEVVNADQGGVCASMNSIIATLPKTIPNSYVISSIGCTDAADNLHFNSAGYRELGNRYAVKMLSLMGIEATVPQDPKDPKDPKGTESIYFEPECATIGGNWDIKKDDKASNGSYVIVKFDKESLTAAPGTSESEIYFTFTTAKDSTYFIFGRLNHPTADDDSYWVKMDDGEFAMANNLVTSGWQWMQIGNLVLSKGEHTLTIAHRENGAKLDKICISNYAYAPTGMGEAALKTCVPDIPSVGINLTKAIDGYAFGQNFPNPFSGKTSIVFEIPNNSFVSLKVYNIFGTEIAELAGKEYSSGKHIVEFDAQNLPKGIYFYTLETDDYSLNRKMVLLGE